MRWLPLSIGPLGLQMKRGSNETDPMVSARNESCPQRCLRTKAASLEEAICILDRLGMVLAFTVAYQRQQTGRTVEESSMARPRGKAMIRALGECIVVVVATLGCIYFIIDSLLNWGL